MQPATSEPVKRLCIICRQRTGRYLNNRICKPCSILTAAEGTRKQYGLPLPRNPRRRITRFITVYNKAMREGKTQDDVAKILGVSRQTVKNNVVELRKKGIQLERSRYTEMHRTRPSTPVDRSLSKRAINEHGGGKWGIAKCSCDPCLQVRRRSSAQWRRDNRDKVETYRETYETKRKPS